jgi:hypothetical protein
MIEKIDKTLDVSITHNDDVSPFASVSSVGTAFWAKPLSPKAETAAPPISTSQENLHVVNKFHEIDL